MRPNFEACGQEFIKGSKDVYSHYVYSGAVHGVLESADASLITVEGCRALCGTGTAYYPWKDSSNSITTWVLPIIGLLVQAPFESNQAWRTMLLLARWVGSPIAVLSYILWNIKVTGKCALMVDMATKYDEYPASDSDFAIMRDSLYILAIMNQYSVSPGIPPVEAERLLRLVLFSNLLPLPASPNDPSSLVKRRTELASNLREDRKKGVVPVFVSFLWFVFTLGLSIDLAFTDIGTNQTAHNLAIGFLMGWLPILVLASTVDRNLVSADAIRTKLNRLIYDVRCALLDPEILSTYMHDTRTTPEDFSWMHTLGDMELFPKDLFHDFGGQGRSHWHYGVAHPLLAGIESKFMAEYGRDWLSQGYAARLAIVVGSRNINGLKMFDARMIWQILAYQYYAAHGVYLTWGIATGLSLLVMSTGLAYIVFEYCTQSHLSTENYDRALTGLKHTRWFKKHTLFIRLIPDVIINGGKLAWHKIRRGKSRRGRRSLVWAATCKKNPQVIEARKEQGLHMQGTEAQWKDVFFGGKHKSTGGLTSSNDRSLNTPDQVPSMRHDRADLEKG
ncbi:MAG: hypothetical protein Q9186_002724 [Xanthomendoza sp. 1 TL-2023]